ncbi:MAG: SRPBCC domain-containing protein [Bdellovibrionales bacterium]|nr:SRPBCC domain-containing protein [Bdellovibrionales bacterium]
MAKSNVETIIENNKVTYKRHFDVPIDIVFEVWSSAEHLSKWWGPDGFTITTKSLDFKNGGIWEYIMHGPDGHNFKNRVQFLDIKKPHHIFLTMLGDGEGDKDVDFESRIYFEDMGGGTNLMMEQIFPSKEELERVDKKYSAIEGGKQHLGNLANYLKTL